MPDTSQDYLVAQKFKNAQISHKPYLSARYSNGQNNKVIGPTKSILDSKFGILANLDFGCSVWYLDRNCA